MQLLTLQLTSKDKLLAGQINHSWNCAYILGNKNGQPSDILVHAVIFALDVCYHKGSDKVVSSK